MAFAGRHLRQCVPTSKPYTCITYPILLGLILGGITLGLELGLAGITCGGRFAAEHSLQVAVLPCLRRFLCDCVNAVSTGVFPHIAQTSIAAESGPIGVAGGLLDCVNENMVGNELRCSKPVLGSCHTADAHAPESNTCSV